jgi:hypothetical protein
MANHLKSEAEAFERSEEVVRSVDEDCNAFEWLFLLEFAEKQQRELRHPRLKQPGV